jgi:hypothetical protein
MQWPVPSPASILITKSSFEVMYLELLLLSCFLPVCWRFHGGHVTFKDAFHTSELPPDSGGVPASSPARE